MSIRRVSLFLLPFLLILMILIGVSAVAQATTDPIIPVVPVPTTSPTTTTQPPGISVVFQSDVPGNLFKAGQPIRLMAVIDNVGEEQDAEYSAFFTTAAGCPVWNEGPVTLHLGANSITEHSVAVPNSEMFPIGPYRLDVAVAGNKTLGTDTTLVSIWTGPAPAVNDRFGISYDGPLSSPTTWRDMDLFAEAGVGWLRFPLQGWSSEEGVNPAQVTEYNAFIQEATLRNFSLLAAFLPRVTVDRAVNPEQADQEYSDSLQAAASRYGSQISYWELQEERPNPLYPTRKGTTFSQMLKGRAALAHFYPKLHAVCSSEDPFATSMLNLFKQGLMVGDDVMGMRYNFIGIPENDTQSVPPAMAMPNVMQEAEDTLHHRPSAWVTEYGFEPSKGDALPTSVQQAALLARALVMDRAAGIERSFWRHRPGSEYDLPFTSEDGSVEPNFLALRTTLERLNGMELVQPNGDLSQPEKGVRAYLFQTVPTNKHEKPSYMLVAWSEDLPAALTLRTDAMNIQDFDPWGSAIELRPVNGTCLLQIDENPRFAVLGDTNPDNVKIYPPFIRIFDDHNDPRPVLTDTGKNTLTFKITYDSTVLKGPFSSVFNFTCWPLDSGTTVKTEKVYIEPPSGTYEEKITSLSIPPGARKGQIYTLNVDIMVGARRVGYFTLPVLYQPTPPTP